MRDLKNNMTSKGQVTLEFIVGFAVILLVLALVVVYSNERELQRLKLEEIQDLQAKCERMANAVNAVFVAGWNAEQRMENDANAWIDQNRVYVNVLGKKAWEGAGCAHASAVNKAYSAVGNFKIVNRNGIIIE